MACDWETFSRAGPFNTERQPPIHRANDVKNYKEENHIKCTEWPAVTRLKCNREGVVKI